MYDGPIREGSRGGRDQFSWEAVKGDKDREFYLGHSVKALVGHWQKNKDPYWYTRNRQKHNSALQDEIKVVKEREENLMLEALGMKKPVKRQTSSEFGKRLQKYEVDGMLRRRDTEESDPPEKEERGMRGLGYRRTASTLVASSTHEVLEGVGLNKPAKSNVPNPDVSIVQDPKPKRKKKEHRSSRRHKSERETSEEERFGNSKRGKDRFFEKRRRHSRSRSPRYRLK